MAELTLKLPKGKTIPPIVLDATDEELYEIVVLGATVWEVVQTTRSSEAVQREIAIIQQKADEERKLAMKREEETVARLTRQKEKELADIQATKAQDIQRMEAMMLEMKKRGETMDAEIRAVRADAQLSLSNLRFNLEKERAMLEAQCAKDRAVAESRVAEMVARKQVVEDEYNAKIAQAVEQERASSTRLMVEKDKELQRVLLEKKEEREKFQHQIESLSEKFTSLRDAITKKPASMKEKGTVFETYIQNLAKQFWDMIPGFKIDDESIHGHKGDLWMSLEFDRVAIITMLECKDYDYTVPTKEVKKFKDDVRANHAIQIGIMISKSTGITGHDKFNRIDFDIVEGKLHIYVNKFDSFEPASIMATLMGFIRYWVLLQKPATDEADKTAAIRIIHKLVENAQLTKAQATTHIHNMNSATQFFSQVMRQTLQALQDALKVLESGVPENTIQESRCFKDVTGQHVTKQKCVQAMQEITEEDAEASIFVADIAKRICGPMSLSVDTVADHIKSMVVDEYLEKTGRGIKINGLRLKSEVV